MRRSLALSLAFVFVAACTPAEHQAVGPNTAGTVSTGSTGPSTTSTPTSLPPVAGPAPSVEFVEDNFDAVMARAKAEKKAVFVDAWALWCHTCLSMKNYVLVDPALKPFEDRVIFAAVDTDKPESSAFLDRYKMSFWPTFFVLDPNNGDVVGYFPGAASAREMKTFIEDALHVLDASAKPGDPLQLLAQASNARAAGEPKKALALYDEILSKTDAKWPRRSEALAGKLNALASTGDPDGCARFGTSHIDEVTGAAAPADFASVMLTCAGRLAKSVTQDAARKKAMQRIESLIASPPPESTADDRADVLAMLASAKSEAGDVAGARAAHEKRLLIMEKAAKEAKTPEIAATYDYGRAISYLALGRAEEAMRMLEAREKEMPKSYDPPARLTNVLLRMGKLDAALAANGRAVVLSYGPRRLGYLRVRADIQARLGDKTGQIATLKEEVAGHEALPKGQLNAAQLEDAKRRLAAVQADTGTAAKP
jgi:tetratricopeptide (TPR) repeat protein